MTTDRRLLHRGRTSQLQEHRRLRRFAGTAFVSGRPERLGKEQLSSPSPSVPCREFASDRQTIERDQGRHNACSRHRQLHQRDLSLVRQAGATRLADRVRWPSRRVLQYRLPRQVRTRNPPLRRGEGVEGAQLLLTIHRRRTLAPDPTPARFLSPWLADRTIYRKGCRVGWPPAGRGSGAGLPSPHGRLAAGSAVQAAS